MLVHGTYDIAHVGRDRPHGAYYILHGDNVISAACHCTSFSMQSSLGALLQFFDCMTWRDVTFSSHMVHIPFSLLKYSILSDVVTGPK